MNFTLDHNEISLRSEGRCIRLLSNVGDNMLLANVSMKETKEVVSKNYYLVKEHYQPNILEQMAHDHLEKVSLKIVLKYFYMYQLWRSMYKKQEKRDLAFMEKDFEHPYTADEITAYFKKEFPKDYHVKCALMLGMTIQQFKDHEKRRQEFFDMW